MAMKNSEHRILLKPEILSEIPLNGDIALADQRAFIYIACNVIIFSTSIPAETEFSWTNTDVFGGASSFFLFNKSREEISAALGYDNTKTITARLRSLEKANVIKRFEYIGYRKTFAYMVHPRFYTVDTNAQ